MTGRRTTTTTTNPRDGRQYRTNVRTNVRTNDASRADAVDARSLAVDDPPSSASAGVRAPKVFGTPLNASGLFAVPDSK
jgi:hypothetical protein